MLQSPAQLHQNPLLGIGLKVASVAVFMVMLALIKPLPHVPTGEVVFIRSVFSMVPILIFLAVRGELAEGLRTARPLGHLWRGIVGIIAMALSYYSVIKLPLPEAVAIGYASPLFIVILGALFGGETVRLFRWSAVLVGLVGVGIVSWPRLTVFSAPAGGVSDLALGAIAALAGGFFAALAMLQIRKLVPTERSSTIVIYFCVSGVILSLLTLPFGWVWLTPTELAMLTAAGLCAGVGQIMLTEAYRQAEMSVIAPFDYSSLIFSTAIALTFFHEVPTLELVIGGLVVVASGLLIIFRERQLGIERRREREQGPS